MTKSNIMYFVGGIIAGTVVTSIIKERKFKKYMDNYYTEADYIDDDDEYIAEEDEDEEEIEDKFEEYEEAVKEYTPEPVKRTEPTDEPYIITPKEFAEFDDYEVVGLTYYEGDGFVADYQDNLIDDVESTIGFEALENFGLYEEDIIHVRNDALKSDYEITLDPRSYKEVVKED